MSGERTTHRRKLLLGAVALMAVSHPLIRPLSALAGSSPLETDTKASQPPKDLAEDAILRPNDIIPRQELSSVYNTHIYDLPHLSNYVTLNVRRIATQRENFLPEPGSNKRLNIHLLDAPYIDRDVLTPEQAKNNPQMYHLLEKLRETLLREAPKMYADQKNEAMEQYEADYQNLLQEYGGDINDDWFMVKEMALKYIYRPFLEEPTMEDIMQGAGGLTVYLDDDPQKIENGYGSAPEDYPYRHILLPVRNPDIVFRHGNAEIHYNYLEGITNHNPTPEDSYPSPEMFEVDLTNKVYPIISGHTIGTVLGHEWGHTRNIRHPFNEYLLMEELAEAHQAYLKGDDTLYPFVFETPPLPGQRYPQVTITHRKNRLPLAGPTPNSRILYTI